MTDKDIVNFWKWFSDNKSKLESDNYEPSFLQKLDRTLSKWNLKWEVGPGVSTENSLTVSPDGKIDLLPTAQLIIDKAPNIDNWEFYSAKQPKSNWFLLEFTNDDFKIDASGWEYVLLKYDDDKIEILIKAETITEFDKEAQELIIDIVLTNLLGERVYMDRIDYFDIVEDFESENGVTELKYLPEHLEDQSFFKK